MNTAQLIWPGAESFSRKKAQNTQKGRQEKSGVFPSFPLLRVLRLFAAKQSAVHYGKSGNTTTGSVLVVVLVVCLGLVSLALVLGHSMLMAYRGADNEFAGRQADAATLGGVRYAESLMTNVTNPGDVPDPATYQSAAVPVGDAQFWFIGTPGDAATTGTANPVDQPTFGLVDEASKLNLNRATFEMIRLLPNMTDDLAQAIVTWRTPPSTSGTSSSTSATSTGVSITSGPVKQGFMESVDELGLVIGGTDPTLLNGDDANLNHVLDPEESSTAGGLGNGQFTAGLLEYCTVFSREPNTTSDGTSRTAINKQGAVIALLNSTLGESRGREVAGAVIASLIRDQGMLPAHEPGGSTAPRNWVGSVLEFYARSGLSPDEFAKIAPSLANSTGGAYTSGQININTASQTVLTCVPGIGDAYAAALVNIRAQRGTSADQSDWSWVITALGAHNCRAAGPWLTTRSYQMSADVAAVGRFGRGYRRARFVIDASTGTPQVVYRRDLAYLGWALGRDERANVQIVAGTTQGGGAR